MEPELKEFNQVRMHRRQKRGFQKQVFEAGLLQHEKNLISHRDFRLDGSVLTKLQQKINYLRDMPVSKFKVIIGEHPVVDFETFEKKKNRRKKIKGRQLKVKPKMKLRKETVRHSQSRKIRSGRMQRYINRDTLYRSDLFRQLRYVENLAHNHREPTWLLIKRIPVLPPDIRPILLLEDAQVLLSDLTKLYVEVIQQSFKWNKRIRDLE